MNSTPIGLSRMSAMDTIPLLKSWISPSGSISWTGPEIFGSDDSNPVIRNATPDKTGIYEAVALNGYCKQKKMLQIEVKKQINLDNFKIGETFTGKLRPVRVKGGLILADTTFTFKDR